LNSILDPVAGSCEYGNELSGSVKDGWVPDQLSDCPLLMKVSCLPWNVFTATSFKIRYQSFYYSTLSLNRVQKIGSVAKERILWACKRIANLLVLHSGSSRFDLFWPRFSSIVQYFATNSGVVPRIGDYSFLPDPVISLDA
jgi:hypothetical protein